MVVRAEAVDSLFEIRVYQSGTDREGVGKNIE